MPNPSTIAAEAESDPQFVKKSDLKKSDLPTPYRELVDVTCRNGELTYQLESLGTALGVMGQQRNEAYERGSRLLRQNCDMTQVTRDLAAIARAAKRFVDAVDAYFGGPCMPDSDEFNHLPTDAQTDEVASANCELDMLLEQHAKLYVRD